MIHLDPRIEHLADLQRDFHLVHAKQHRAGDPPHEHRHLVSQVERAAGLPGSEHLVGQRGDRFVINADRTLLERSGDQTTLLFVFVAVHAQQARCQPPQGGFLGTAEREESGLKGL